MSVSPLSPRKFFVLAGLLLALMGAGPAWGQEPDQDQAKINFQSADANADQKLDRTEFETFINLNAEHGLGKTAKIRRFGAYGKAFAKIDGNGDGFVTREELQKAKS